MGLLRLFLALSVVVWHMPNRSFNLLDASVAVLFFFMISGFYMALVINERYGTTEIPGWRGDFYLSRVFRLFPTYLFMIAVMVAWFKWTDTPSVFLNHPNVPLGAHIALAAMNLFIFGQDFFQLIVNSIERGQLNSFTNAVVSHAPREFFVDQWMLVGQAWSLASELLFYALAPFIVRSIPRIVGCLAASLCVRFALIFIAGCPSETWGYNFFPATLCFFLMGSLAYHLYNRVRFENYAATIGMAITIVFALLVVGCVWRFGGALLVTRKTGFDTFWLWPAYILFSASIPFLFARWKKSRIDRAIGELSYPLYIVHGAIIGIVFHRIDAGQSTREFIAVTCSVVAAAAIYVLIDRPIDVWRHRKFWAHEKPSRSWMLVPISTVIALVVYTSALDAVTRPEAAPPILVGTARKYNIVHYDDRYFAVLQGQPITWGAPGYESVKGLIIGASYSAVLHEIR